MGARMVPFAGYAMPVQYDFAGELAARCKGGVMAEHVHTRTRATLFDVSHMGQARLSGAGAAAALERLVPGDIQALKPGRQRYTLLMNEIGGIIDDLMVANLGRRPALPGGQREPQGRTTSATSPPACRTCGWTWRTTEPCWRCKARRPLRC